eukprot:2076861-Amphidinium_carterae.1
MHAPQHPGWPLRQLPDYLGSLQEGSYLRPQLVWFGELDQVELASLSEGIPSSHFKVFVPRPGLSLATLNGLQGFHHSFTVTDNSPGSALLQGPHHGEEFSSNNRLPAARQREPGSFTSVSDVANPTSPGVGVATVSARPIGPD